MITVAVIALLVFCIVTTAYVSGCVVVHHRFRRLDRQCEREVRVLAHTLGMSGMLPVRAFRCPPKWDLVLLWPWYMLTALCCSALRQQSAEKLAAAHARAHVSWQRFLTARNQLWTIERN